MDLGKVTVKGRLVGVSAWEEEDFIMLKTGRRRVGITELTQVGIAEMVAEAGNFDLAALGRGMASVDGGAIVTITVEVEGKPRLRPRT